MPAIPVAWVGYETSDVRRSILGAFIFFTVLITCQAQWVQTPIPASYYVGAIMVSDSNVFVGTDHAMYLSSDGGLSWLRPTNYGMEITEIIYGFAVKDSFLFAVTASNGVFRSSDRGLNWQPVNNGLSATSGYCITLVDSCLFVGISSAGIFRSCNDGETWQAANNGLTNFNVQGFGAARDRGGGTSIFAGTGRGVFLSTDHGESWQARNNGLADSSVYVFTVLQDTILFASTFGSGIFVTNDYGGNWRTANNGLTNLKIQPVITSLDGNTLFTGTWGNGVFASTDNGEHWHSSLLPNSYKVNALGVGSTDIFAGVGHGGGVWQNKLSSALGVGPQWSDTPQDFSLRQNYPNPFNPATTFEFTLSTQSIVTLKVFDLLGREVATILDNLHFAVGTHKAVWDASSVSSGIYIYRLQVENHTDARKMTLLR